MQQHPTQAATGHLLYRGCQRTATLGSSHRSRLLTLFLERNERDQSDRFIESNKDGDLTPVRAPSVQTRSEAVAHVQGSRWTRAASARVRLAVGRRDTDTVS